MHYRVKVLDQNVASVNVNKFVKIDENSFKSVYNVAKFAIF